MLISFFDFEIRFDIGSLFVFLSGVVLGVILASLVYVYSLLRTLKNKKHIVDSDLANEIKEEDIKEIIKKYQDYYLDNRKNKDKDIASNAIKEALKGTTYEIAQKFFPNSKKPLFEITIDEAIMLSHYISQRVDELLGHRGIRIIRKIKISQILNIMEKTRKINNSQVVQSAKKYKVKEIIKTGISALNIVNPFYWVKKGISKISTGLVLKKIVLIIISITGEETYKIYSKQAFREQDPNYIQMMKEINEALEDSEEFNDLNDEELNEFVDNLPTDEQNILLSMEHQKKKRFWKRLNKEKVTSK